MKMNLVNPRLTFKVSESASGEMRSVKLHSGDRGCTLFWLQGIKTQPLILVPSKR